MDDWIGRLLRYARLLWGIALAWVKVAILTAISILLGAIQRLPYQAILVLALGTIGFGLIAVLMVNEAITVSLAARADRDLPRFEFEDTSGAMLYHNETAMVGTSINPQPTQIFQVPKWWTLLVRIKNSPQKKTSRSDATNVVAIVKFYDAYGTEVGHSFIGRWITKAEAATHVGAHATADRIDIPANGMCERLYVAMRPNGTQQAFGYAQENIAAYHDGRHPLYALPLPEYRVDILLSCSQAHEQVLQFRLTTDGPDDQPLKLVPYN
jgi:hypothetical protein